MQLLAAPEAPVSETERPQVQDLPGVHPSGKDNEVPGLIRPAETLEFSADYALIYTGRRPWLCVEELNALGIRHDRRGIIVDPQQMTSVPGIYAVGDVTGGMMLAHRAMQQGKSLAARLFGGQEIRFLEEAVTTVIYTHPQIARVGMTEKEALRMGIAVDVHRIDWRGRPLPVIRPVNSSHS